MYALAIGRKAAAAPELRRRPTNRRDDIVAAPADATPTLGVESAPTLGEIAVVTPIRKRYRAIVTRNRVERAVVEFDADETADFYTLAQDLIRQIPADAWTVDPVSDSTWGYLDRVEEVPASVEAVEEVGEPIEEALTPAATLSRRLRAKRSAMLRAKRRAGLRKADDAATAIAEGYAELDAIRAEAEAVVAAGDAESLVGFAQRLNDLYMNTPVADFDGNPIPEGQQLEAAIREIEAWLDEQYELLVSSPSETLSRRRSQRSRRGRKEDGFDDGSGFVDDADMEATDDAIYAEIDAIEAEATAALDSFDAGTSTASEAISALQALGERLIAIDTTAATSVATSEVSATASWLDSEIASLSEADIDETVDAPIETLSRRRRAA